jgi:hypothetical protein
MPTAAAIPEGRQRQQHASNGGPIGNVPARPCPRDRNPRQRKAQTLRELAGEDTRQVAAPHLLRLVDEKHYRGGRRKPPRCCGAPKPLCREKPCSR